MVMSKNVFDFKNPTFLGGVGNGFNVAKSFFFLMDGLKHHLV